MNLLMKEYNTQIIQQKQELVLPDWKPHLYSVLPLLTVKMSMRKEFFVGLTDSENPFTAATGSFLIQGIRGHNVIIDTGSSAEDFLSHGCPCEEIETMEVALYKAAGLTPKDIDTVIFTHLHHDHTALATLFKHAKFFVQQEEWSILHNTPPCYQNVYHPKYLEGCMPTIVSGDTFNIFPGIHLLYTPGHTPGGQSVVVDTMEGRVIICGFCCIEDNFTSCQNADCIWPVQASGLHMDNKIAYESLLRVKKAADYIITPHDILSFERGQCPGINWIKIKQGKEGD